MHKFITLVMLAMISVFVATGLSACGGSAHGQGSPQPLKANQTQGFAGGQHLTFTYTQSFDCVDEPGDDLNYDGVLAQSNPLEFQTPICQAATQPTVTPTGVPFKAASTPILYVLVPMFGTDTNPADAIQCGPKGRFRPGTLCNDAQGDNALGSTLISLFGIVPEAFMEKPTVFTDCPNPTDPPGTCTMHASTVDLGKVLASLFPSKGFGDKNIYLPTPNHSHIISSKLDDTKPIWWQVNPVLIEDPSYWPNEDGTKGITSLTKLKAAEKSDPTHVIEVPSNFYLFFGSKMAGM